ncbi:unnamed protein product [Cylicostephanus goldi]|uniref:Uncharacterized protein n=1 Tax=Cylicostephanus goldi TaxID=71465 RepID=A0A3P7M016_CYLGO|nr:unnamed protein product [Cylicostephanus goldi]
MVGVLLVVVVVVMVVKLMVEVVVLEEELLVEGLGELLVKVVVGEESQIGCLALELQQLEWHTLDSSY